MPKLDARKVSIFYAYKGTGFSETYYSQAAIGDVPKAVKEMLKLRLAFADDNMEAKYARISNMNNPRETDFLDLADEAGNVGKIKEDGCSPTDVILLRTRSTGGRQSHFFIHGFPAKYLKEDVVVPAGSWMDKLKAWGDHLGSNLTAWGMLSALNGGVPERKEIASASPQSPRGYIITAVAAPAVAIGNTIAVGGTSKDGYGFQGRKAVLNVDVAAKQILVGGAKPIGPIGTTAYYNLLIYSVARFKDIRPVKLTERKVGRIFGQPVGRRPATLPLAR